MTSDLLRLGACQLFDDEATRHRDSYDTTQGGEQIDWCYCPSATNTARRKQRSWIPPIRARETRDYAMKRLFGRLPPVSPTATGLVLAASGLVVVSESWYSPRIACESTQDTPSLVSAKVPKNRLIFLGSGSSTGCPRPLCTMLFNEKSLAESGSDPVLKELRDQFQEKCLVSKRATVGNPLHNKDYRNNPSLLIAQYDENTGQTKHVVIDVGKTFREASLRWFPYHGIAISTHHHLLPTLSPRRSP